jgi:dehydrogenase/reductase SDR family member 1
MELLSSVWASHLIVTRLLSQEHLLYCLLPMSIALVCGGSRGVGRGCAIGLGEAGMTVWVSGRTAEDGSGPVPLGGSVASTAAEVTAAGGRGVARRCDHMDDDAVERLVDEVLAAERRLDVVVNAVWGGYERFVGVGPLSWGPFWEQPLSLWDSMHMRGVRAAYVASSLAARAMVAQGSGLIVCISSFAARRFTPPVAYGVAHAATDRMVADMAQELAGTGVTAVALYPGLVRTENVLANAAYFDLSDSESPQFIGRAIAALAADPAVAERSGKALVAVELAAEYGFTDVD